MPTHVRRVKVVRLHDTADEVILRALHAGQSRVRCNRHACCVQVEGDVLEFGALKLDHPGRVPEAQRVIHTVTPLAVGPTVTYKPCTRPRDTPHNRCFVHRKIQLLRGICGATASWLQFTVVVVVGGAALQIAVNVAERLPVTKEGTQRNLVQRLCSVVSGISWSRLRGRELSTLCPVSPHQLLDREVPASVCWITHVQLVQQLDVCVSPARC